MTQARRSAALLETLLAAAMVIVALTLVLIPLLGPGGLGVGTGPIFGRLPVVQAQLSRELGPQLPTLEGTFQQGDAIELGAPVLVTATIFSPSPSQRLGLIGGRVLAGLTALAVLGLLLQIVRSLRRNDVFIDRNAQRLRRLAAVLGVGGMAAQLLTAFGTVRVVDAATVRGSVLPVFELSYLPLLGALGVGVLAEVFRQGAALRQEVDGLV